MATAPHTQHHPRPMTVWAGATNPFTGERVLPRPEPAAPQHMHKGRSATKNPWGLTPAQERSLRELCTWGSMKLVARSTGLSAKTIEKQMQSARRKMSAAMPGRGRIAYLVAFDRWDREQRGKAS